MSYLVRNTLSHQLEIIRERGLQEWRILAAATADLAKGGSQIRSGDELRLSPAGQICRVRYDYSDRLPDIL